MGPSPSQGPDGWTGREVEVNGVAIRASVGPARAPLLIEEAIWDGHYMRNS